MWCGGNELFNSWGGMTEQSLALRLLNSQCLLLDPKTPYINTSPIIGMAHGHYVFRDWENGEEVYARMARSHNTAYTEFGMPAPSSIEVLKTIIPENELWPPQRGASWESHHAFNAWVGDTWLMQGMIEDYFGKSKNLEELISNGQLLQSEGYKAIYEEARRQKPYCSMALNWCFNEPWPTAANNTLINWPYIPKPGFFAVSDACRPFLASAKITNLKWKEGEEFSSDIWLLNDLYENIPSGKLIVKLKSGEKEVHLLSWDFDALEANKNLAGPTVRASLPAWETDRFELVLEVEGHPEYNSVYTMLYVPKPKPKKQSTAILNQ
jgi:beta-mannosidase